LSGQAAQIPVAFDEDIYRIGGLGFSVAQYFSHLPEELDHARVPLRAQNI
jgi:hypothetical protein